MAHVLAQDLRNAVLQAAIEGKLSIQKETDSSVKDNIEQLSKAKKEFIDSGRFYKKKPTDPFYSNDYPFSIPSNWEWVQLSEVSIIQEGAGIRKYQYKDEGIQLFSVTNILEGAIDLEKKQLFVSEEEYLQKYKHLTLNKGDIVSACSGGSWGKTAIYNEDEIVMLNTSTLRLRFFNDLSNNKYLYYVCKSLFFKKQLQAQLAGIQPNFGYAHYSRICFPLPPIEEQSRIVARIEELMAKIDKYEQTENELARLKAEFPENMKDSILQAAMEGKLTEQLESDENIRNRLDTYGIPLMSISDEPFDIPNSWEWHKFGEFGELKSGYAFKSSNYISTGIQVVRISDLGEDEILPNDNVFYQERDDLKKYEIKDGSFLICLTGSIGKMARVNDGKKRYLNQRVGMFIPSEIVNNDYLWLFLHTNYVIEQWIKSKTSTNGNIKNSNITELLIPIPPIEEQERIVKKLNKLLPLCDRLEQLA